MSNNFIERIAPIIREEAKKRGYKTFAGVIAQAICESNWGKSLLSSRYHNYFGLKTGKNYCGKSVNMKTKEEYTVGTLTTISDNFRVYDNMEEGVKGYYDFINTKRYANLKNATDYKTYINLIKQDGYATSSSYINTLNKIVVDNHLTDWENGTEITNYKEDESLDLNDAADIIAGYVIKGYFGNGKDRKKSIYTRVQNTVNNKLMNYPDVTSSDLNNAINTIADYVIKGYFGNGEDRMNGIYKLVQDRVNKKVRKG